MAVKILRAGEAKRKLPSKFPFLAVKNKVTSGKDEFLVLVTGRRSDEYVSVTSFATGEVYCFLSEELTVLPVGEQVILTQED